MMIRAGRSRRIERDVADAFNDLLSAGWVLWSAKLIRDCIVAGHAASRASDIRGAARSESALRPLDIVRGDDDRLIPAGSARVTDWDPGAQAGMRTPPVVVSHPFAKDPSELALVEWDQPVQTLPTHRADQSLTEGVRLRSPRERLEHPPAHRPGRPVHACRIDLIPVMAHEPV
jgi:hypothetical protein